MFISITIIDKINSCYKYPTHNFAFSRTLSYFCKVIYAKAR